MTAEYDFWLLDLDGTLVDVEPSYIREVIHSVGQRIGYQFTPEQARRLWHGLGGPPEAQLQQWGLDPTAFWTAFHDVEDALARVDATFLYPDAEVVRTLDGPVGLVTHCQPYLTTPVLESLNIEGWFDVVVCCDDEVGWKPDPGPVERAIGELPLSTEDQHGVLIGDTVTDVGAARNAGLDGIHLERHDPTLRGHPIRADTRIESLDELSGRAYDASVPDDQSMTS